MSERLTNSYVATPGPAADLIEHAAGIIVAKRREPHTAPAHWAGALWEAGMLVAPGTANPELDQLVAAALALRDAEGDDEISQAWADFDQAIDAYRAASHG